MSTASRTLRASATWAVLFGALVLFLVWVIFAPPPQRLRLACDSAVGNFLSATDIVALERAKFLIEHLRCSIADRLPEPTS